MDVYTPTRRYSCLEVEQHVDKTRMTLQIITLKCYELGVLLFLCERLSDAGNERMYPKWWVRCGVEGGHVQFEVSNVIGDARARRCSSMYSDLFRCRNSANCSRFVEFLCLG